MIEFKEHLETDDIATYKGKWKNLHFTKNGKSSLSSKQSFDSKELAENRMREWIAENEQLYKRTGRDVSIRKDRYDPFSHVFYWPSEYSHTIQIPVGDE